MLLNTRAILTSNTKGLNTKDVAHFYNHRGNMEKQSGFADVKGIQSAGLSVLQSAYICETYQ